MMAPPSAAASPEELVRGASALVIDSRAVCDGSIFVALRGSRTDGHAFIDDAVRRGARMVVMEEEHPLPAGVRGIVVADSARMLSRLAHAFYGRPSTFMTMLGVTGTNGKTTVVAMLSAILNAAGIPCGVLGTLGASFSGKAWRLGNTTPLAPELHAMLAQMHDRGAAAVAMEVSSHALALQRVADIHFKIAVLTNISRDHLDFHTTFEAYAAAKRSLFGMADVAVLNADDSVGREWAAEPAAPRVVRYAIGDASADVRATGVTLRADHTVFTVGPQRFCLPVPGRFNVSNALAAIACARELGVADARSADALENLAPVRGRMEYVHGDDVHVVIDYAHTPDALENILRTLRETAAKRLTVIFGCGGDRDRGKRAEMGRIASRMADRVVVTNDNPRTEDPRCIAEDIVAGIAGRYTLTLDRRAAIHEAIRTAERDEIVLIAGKGHETYQIIGEQTVNFDDREVALDALRMRTAPHP